MTPSRSVPSQVEPDALAELIADARAIALPHQTAADAAPGRSGSQPVVIPAVSVSLVEGYADYGG
jgi:hypothetical protein